MAANLVSVTVTELNGNALVQDGVKNIFALNKKRCRQVTPVDSGNDSRIEFMASTEGHRNAMYFDVDDTFATLQTALVTNAYTAGQSFTFPVLTENGNEVNENRILEMDAVVYAVANPENTNQTLMMYQAPGAPAAVKLIINLTLAGLITLTTT